MVPLFRSVPPRLQILCFPVMQFDPTTKYLRLEKKGLRMSVNSTTINGGAMLPIANEHQSEYIRQKMISLAIFTKVMRIR